MGGVDVGDQGIRVEFKNRLGLRFVGGDPLLDDAVGSIVHAVVLERALAHPAGQFLAIRTGEVEDLVDLQEVGDHLGLRDIARNAVEYQKVDVRLVNVGVAPVVDLGFPQLDGQFIRHQIAAAGIMDEALADGGAGVERAEDIAAGAVEEARDGPEDFPLGALARTRRAEDQECGTFGVECL